MKLNKLITALCIAAAAAIAAPAQAEANSQISSDEPRGVALGRYAVTIPPDAKTDIEVERVIARSYLAWLKQRDKELDEANAAHAATIEGRIETTKADLSAWWRGNSWSSAFARIIGGLVAAFAAIGLSLWALYAAGARLCGHSPAAAQDPAPHIL